jgi:hypothetical protein
VHWFGLFSVAAAGVFGLWLAQYMIQQTSSVQSVLFKAGYASSGSDFSPSSLNSDTQVVCGFAIAGSCLLYICTLLFMCYSFY